MACLRNVRVGELHVSHQPEQDFSLGKSLLAGTEVARFTPQWYNSLLLDIMIMRFGGRGAVGTSGC